MIRIILESLVAFIAVYLFAVILESPKRSLFHAALTGAIGWFVYLICLEIMAKIPATLMAGLAISFLSHYYARKLKTPATVYFLSGFIPLVPGAGVYQAVFSFINGNYGEAQMNLNETLLISGAIAVAIFIVDTFFSLQMRLRTIRKAKKKEQK